jgi:hypothetical protein
MAKRKLSSYPQTLPTIIIMILNDQEMYFSPDNLLLLRGILNTINIQPSFYENHVGRLAAADLAFFAHDASLDDRPHGGEEFHQSYFDFRSGKNEASARETTLLRMRRAVFDHVSSPVGNALRT